MYFIVDMLCINSFCNNLSDNSGLRCGSSIVACAHHSRSNSVIWSWKFLLVLLRWILPTTFKRNNVLVVGDRMQSFCFIREISFTSPYLTNM